MSIGFQPMIAEWRLGCVAEREKGGANLQYPNTFAERSHPAVPANDSPYGERQRTRIGSGHFFYRTCASTNMIGHVNSSARTVDAQNGPNEWAK